MQILLTIIIIAKCRAAPVRAHVQEIDLEGGKTIDLFASSSLVPHMARPSSQDG